jgi:hypothetical protein
MSTERQKQSNEPAKDQEQYVEPAETLEGAVDARDLVMKSGNTQTPAGESLTAHPAVTPQMLNDPGNIRDDLRQGREDEEDLSGG